jgi:NAD(P)-dependent dehydrogenase (short-subunit alcohol dehydrogenase family)
VCQYEPGLPAHVFCRHSGTMTKIALITGANKGMGLEVARQLAEEGMTVLLGSRSLERGEASAAELRSSGLDAHAIDRDVTDDASITLAATRIEGEFGHLDVLVNNAGIAGDEGANTAPSSTTREGMRQIFETNLF